MSTTFDAASIRKALQEAKSSDFIEANLARDIAALRAKYPLYEHYQFDTLRKALEFSRLDDGERKMYSMRLSKKLIARLDLMAAELEWSRAHLLESLFKAWFEVWDRTAAEQKKAAQQRKPRRMGEGRQK